MKAQTKVKVIGLETHKMMNLWGGYDNVSCLLGQTGTITKIINPDTAYEQYGLTFDEPNAQLARERTGILFSASHLQTVPAPSVQS